MGTLHYGDNLEIVTQSDHERGRRVTPKRASMLVKGWQGRIAMREVRQERIAADENVLGGKPVVRGTRLAVEFLIGLLADGWSEEDILSNYPGLTHEDMAACLAYARDVLSSERVVPTAA